MKKLIAIIALVMTGSFGNVIAQKIGHVDIQKLMLAMPERKAAEDTLKKEADRFQADANRMKLKYDQLIIEYNEEKKRGATEAYLQSLVDNIQDYQGRMQQFQEFAEQSLAKREEDLLKPMYDKIKASIKKVMKANSINYVLEVSALVENDGGFDLTPLVAKDLGIVLSAETPNTPTPK